MIVHHRHMKMVNNGAICNPGARAWAKSNGLDWSTFISDGLPEELLLATGDAIAIATVDEARKEWAEKTTTPQ